MKKLILIASVVALLCTPLAAQDTPRYFSVLTVETELAKVPQYESAVKELMAVLGKAKLPYPIFASQSLSHPGFYSYVSPLSSMADMDTRQAAMQKIAAQHAKVMQGPARHSTRHESAIIQPRAELWYQPSNPRLSDGEAPYSRVMQVSVKRGSGLEVEDLLKEFAALNKKLGIRVGYEVYTDVTGEGPTYFFRTLGSSEADFFAQAEKTNATLGEAGLALRRAAGPMITAIEYSSGIARPDLGYQP